MTGGPMEKRNVRDMEQERVDRLLKRDRENAEAERRRRDAEQVVENGGFATQDIVVPPTPEQLAKGDFVSYTPKGENGTVRTVKTVRRLIIAQVDYLFRHGVLDDDLYAACRWYKERYEAAQMEPAAGVASYGESVRGDPVYGHLPRSQWAAEARSDYRYAQAAIPVDVRDLFEQVIIHDCTMSAAAKTARVRYGNVRAAFMRAALELHGGIAHRLEIERKFQR